MRHIKIFIRGLFIITIGLWFILSFIWVARAILNAIITDLNIFESYEFFIIKDGVYQFGEFILAAPITISLIAIILVLIYWIGYKED